MARVCVRAAKVTVTDAEPHDETQHPYAEHEDCSEEEVPRVLDPICDE